MEKTIEYKGIPYHEGDTIYLIGGFFKKKYVVEFIGSDSTALLRAPNGRTKTIVGHVRINMTENEKDNLDKEIHSWIVNECVEQQIKLHNLVEAKSYSVSPEYSRAVAMRKEIVSICRKYKNMEPWGVKDQDV